MPSISMFFEIVIYMYWKDHLPPHFHAKYQDQSAIFTLDGELLEGDLPIKQKRLVSAWATIHEEELAADWSLAAQGAELYRIEPLR